MWLFFLGLLAALLPSALLLTLMIWKNGVAKPPSSMGAQVVSFPERRAKGSDPGSAAG